MELPDVETLKKKLAEKGLPWEKIAVVDSAAVAKILPLENFDFAAIDDSGVAHVVDVAERLEGIELSNYTFLDSIPQAESWMNSTSNRTPPCGGKHRKGKKAKRKGRRKGIKKQ